MEALIREKEFGTIGESLLERALICTFWLYLRGM